MQPAQLLVEVDQAGGDAGQAAVALVGGVGDIHRVGHGLEKALEAAFGDALFAQLVEPLFGLDDLFARLAVDLDLGGLGRDVAAERDQFAPHGEVVDHLGIVARGIGRDRGPGEAGEIGGAAQFLQPRIILEKGLERDRRGERVLLDAGGGDLEDAGVDGIVEMLGADQRGDAVIDVVVGQDHAQKLLFGLDIVRQSLGVRDGRRAP